MARIAVIVPVYKVEEYLHRCVDSILGQTYQEFEMVLVDDGSPDDCGKICDDYARNDSRVLVIHKENGGLSDARNVGIDWVVSNSDCEWVTFIDSDDWIHERYLETLYLAAVENQCSLSICLGERTTGESIEIVGDEIDAEVLESEAFFVNNHLFANYAWGKMYKLSLFKDKRYPIGKLHEDEFLTYKILFSQDEVAFIKQPLYSYYLNDESITQTPFSAKKLDAYDAREEQIDFFLEKGYMEAARCVIRVYIAGIYAHLHDCENQRPYNRNLVQLLKGRKKKSKLYLKHLDVSDPNDEFILMKAKPVGTKLAILKKAICKKIRRQKHYE